MIFNRRSFTKVVSAAIALPMLDSMAFAQSDYPSKPVTVIVPYEPGPIEIITRMVTDKLSEKIGQRFLVETRGGAASAIGTDYVVRSPNDGYTLLASSATSMITMKVTTPNLSFDPRSDLKPIAKIFTSPYVLYVNAGLGINSVEELIAYAKENPGELTYSSTGAGAHGHLISELFRHLAGIDILHIPYKGSSPSLQAVATGEVSMHFGRPSQLGQFSTEQAVPIGVTSTSPITQVPDLPVINDLLPGFVAYAGVDWLAPAGTPHEIIEMLHTNILEVLKTPDIARRLAASGDLSDATPAEIAQEMNEDYEVLDNLIQTVDLELQE